MRRKNSGLIVAFIALVVIVIIVGFIKLVGIEFLEITQFMNAKIIFGVLLGISIGAIFTEGINNIRNRKLDKKLRDEIEVIKNFEVMKTEND